MTRNGRFISKLTNILTAVAVAGCLLFQHSNVGARNSDDHDFGSQVFEPSAVPDTIPKNDSLAVTPDSISVDTISADTTIDTESLKSKVKYHARDSLRVDIENELVYLYGDAVVDYEDLHLTADFIKIDFEKKEISAEGSLDTSGALIGKPNFSQGAQEFKSNTMRYNFNSKRGKISYVITHEGEGYIHGETVKKDAENNFYIRNGTYTTCEADTPHYGIRARKLKVISNNKIVTGPAFLTIEGIPTPLLIPFGFFPNKKGRSSGLIFPAFGESTERGFYFHHLGYYLGLNDYLNFALTTDLYTKGSYALQLASVYANRYHYRGRFNISYSNTVSGEKELADYSKSEDFHINWNHTQDPKAKPNSTFSATVDAGSSNFYRNNIASVGNFQRNTLASSIMYQQSFPESPVNFSIEARHLQNIVTHDIDITLPALSLGVQRINPLKRKLQLGPQRWYEKIGVSYQMQATNYVHTKDTTLFRIETLDSLKNGIQHSIPISTSFNILKYVSFAPSLTITDRMYFKTVRHKYIPDTQRFDTTYITNFENAYDYTAQAGLSTRVYGMYQFRKGPVAAIRHVMNPTLSFGIRPDFSEARYGYYKEVQSDATGLTKKYSIFDEGVYGKPPAGKYANLAFGLDNNLEMKVRVNSDSGATLKKIKLLESLSVRGNYNIAADSMKLSPFAVGGRTTLFERLRLNFTGTLNPYAYDQFENDYDRYLYDMNHHLLRLTDFTFSGDFSLSPKAKTNDAIKYSNEELDYIRTHPEEYVDFSIPYNLSVGYSYNWRKDGDAAAKEIQSINVNGDISLTPKWKIGFNSSYDFKVHTFTSFNVNIYRDLHCWEMRLNWIPFGYQAGYFFQINVKSAVLQDLKLMKRKDFYDN
jgi:lipopolysaccharide assembly outer membrane protein LptD (OstA)